MTNNGMEELRNFIVSNYKYIGGNWDIYMAFFEKGLDLSKGILCYITPDKWLSKPFGLKFREKCMLPRMSKILHVGSNIFENVRVDGIISLFRHISNTLETLKFNEQKDISIIEITSKNKINEPYLIDYLFSKNVNLVTKIEHNANNILMSLALCENACATSDAYNLAPFIENNDFCNKENDFIIINTGTIDKYTNKWGRKELTYLGNKILYPIVKRDIFIRNFGRSYVRKAISSKLIFKGLNLLDACFDMDGAILPAKSTLVICNSNIDILKFLGAIINSRLSIFYIKTKYSSSSYCGGITFSKIMLNNLPIPSVNHSLIALVDQILSIKQVNPESDTKLLENEINQLVYELYNLTNEDIAIIENS